MIIFAAHFTSPHQDESYIMMIRVWEMPAFAAQLLPYAGLKQQKQRRRKILLFVVI